MSDDFDDLGFIDIPPTTVHVNRLELCEVYGERFCVSEVTLEWPQTNAVKAIVAIWDHVVASRLLDQVYKLDSGEICEVGTGGLDFLYNSAKKYWHPILDALKTAGYKPTRRRVPKAKEMTKKRIESLRLKPELVPRPLWGRSVCSTLKRNSRWLAIRKHVLEAAGGSCEICGAHQEKGMICHEQWDYDDADNIVTLVGFQLVCADCNLVLHGGWSTTLAADTALRDPEKALELWIHRKTHIERVNQITAQEAQQVYVYAGKQHAKRSQYRWRIKIDPKIRKSFPELHGVRL